MGKALVIAEKPSVAGDIARVLGGCKKVDDYYENDQYVVASAVGHLLELAVPEEHDVARGKWSFDKLPHLPPHFALAPIEKNEKRLKTLAKLIRRKDVDVLINACDAGREGELIFRNIATFAKAKQPVQRLWLQSMTPTAIRDGFQRLRSDAEMQPLAAASRCRSEADWLVGINGTRAMTAFNNRAGGFYLTPVGRVQTPTLAIVVEREERIRRFIPRDYWEVVATFEVDAGTYTGRWFDESFKRPDAKEGDPDLRAERIWEQHRALAIQSACTGKDGVVTEETKPTTQLSPMLFDLTSLQREANSKFGFSARNTLGVAQALYEKHKVLTYPRTDSRHLPEDYQETVRSALSSLSGTAYKPFTEKILKQGWVRPNKRIFNNAKVSDHFAIIPTGQIPKNLSEPEQKLYDLVTRRFLAIFFPPAEFLETVRITRVEGEPFKTVGKVLVKPGWLEIYGKEAAVDGAGAPNLVPVAPGQSVKTVDMEVQAHQTKPPARFTEATLLSAMEGAGKLVEDDELREAMAERGLGTPATRASIIEGLLAEEYMLRQVKELVPTPKATSLIQLLGGLGVNELTRPELTGEWEYQLKKMERGQLDRDQFMNEIRRFAGDIVAKAKRYEHDTIPGDFGVLSVACPKCGGQIHEQYRDFKCKQCDFSVRRVLSGRQFEPAEVETLIREQKLGPLNGFRSKMGRPFSALLKMTPEFKAEFDFGDDNSSDSANQEPVDFGAQEPVGACPKCGARVFLHGMNYVCEKSVGPDKSCKFRSGSVILQQTIERDQFAKLLAEGKTELLKGFVSKRTGRKFEAFLVRKEGGEVGFEFAPREAKRKNVSRSAAAKEPAVKVDLTGKTALGTCPKCGGKVYEGPESFLCERTQIDAKPCTFKVGKLILQQPLSTEQIQRLLQGKKTELLTQFISKKGNPFSAHLKLSDNGKVEFEFPDS